MCMQVRAGMGRDKQPKGDREEPVHHQRSGRSEKSPERPLETVAQVAQIADWELRECHPCGNSGVGGRSIAAHMPDELRVGHAGHVSASSVQRVATRKLAYPGIVYRPVQWRVDVAA